MTDMRPLVVEGETGPTPSNAPIFILSAARSGSTLLRYILDHHPEIACPPESNLSVAAEAMSFSTFSIVTNETIARQKSTEVIRTFFTESIQ